MTSRERVIEIGIWAAVVLFVVMIASLVFGLSYACHRWYGPFMVGSDDPVAVAVYCRGSAR